MELIEQLAGGLGIVVSLLKFILEAVAVFCILIGLVKTLQMANRLTRRQGFEQPFIEIRLCFGSWLALALEFQLGADILATTVTPTFQSLGQLAAIAVIRTFLNYFLNKELEAEYDLQEKSKAKLSEDNS
ncbi:MAG: DUF1622 domain-containing protein [Gomphosphaeria aponina SAG 52.96 = DSM 107014]|uniref:DUF1622 domain-containing protein n=1 Tax=Gomphosphaeria aponina SAG 52.96 = DSM 107014 TaxID=1521640 RepID=A0A941JVK3_9CHRO|nr:DUF1622 domain-containing protein [Gomphosphaeria aponina SAG 52.96 = DSM 107014]